jgi:MSHA biogenesis protein MshQ
MAVACSDIFTNGVQAHGTNGNIRLSFHSIINGGNATLATRNLTDNTSWAGCSGSNCVASGTAALTSTPTFVTGNGANGAINVADSGSASVASGNYLTVGVGQTGTLTFNSAGGNYRTGAMTTQFKSIVEFQSGDYWINGNLRIGQETLLRRIATSGATRIFVNGNVTFDYKVSTTGFTSNQLLIYATGSISVDNETTLDAYLYAGGNVSMDYQVRINGAVSGANFTAADNEVTINYQGSNLSSADFSPFCTVAAVSPVCPAGISGGITGYYYNNRTLTEPSSATRSDAPIDFSWGSGSPGPSGINADSFSTRWTGYVRATQSGNYRFQTVSDDGVRLYINGNLVIDRWTDHSATTDSTVDIPLVAGQAYTIVLHYYEAGGDATIRLLWRLPGAGSYVAIPRGPTPTLGAGLYECTSVSVPPISACPTGSTLVAGITGDYFNNQTLTGSVTATRSDGPINFDWGTGAPGPTAINVDNFSIRWNGYLLVTESGSHRFQTNTDDGVRLTVNGVSLIDQWNDHSATTHTSATISLEAGKAYPIKLEFYENTGFALMQLRWQTPGSASYVVIPVGINSTPISSPGLYQCTTVTGYAISHSGTGITCAGETITFTALDASGNPIKPVSGTTLTLGTSSTTSQWVGGNTAVFDGTVAAVTKILRQPTPATVNINVLDNNGKTESLDPNIIFSDAALKFSNIANQVAGTVTTTGNHPTLSAVKTDQVTGACVPQLSGDRTVRLAFSCINPTVYVSGQKLTLKNLEARANNNGATITYNSHTLNFNSSGIAEIPLKYTDVGQVRLHAQVDLSGSTNDPAVTLVGNSNSFVVKPHTLAVSAIQKSDGASNPQGTNEPGTTKQFVAAGDAFRVFVEARNSEGNRTPNFGKESVSENNIKLVLQSPLVHPAGGTLTPLTGSSSFSAIADSALAGTFVNNNLIWDQVGSIKVRPELSDSNYLGAGDIATFTLSDTIGRFYPHRFELSGGSIVSNCSAFAYMGQPVSLNYTIQAKSILGTIPSNYNSAYGAMPTLTYVAENSESGVNLGGRFTDGLVSKIWTAGVLTFASTNAIFGRQATTGAPDGPFSGLLVGLQLSDTFDSRSLQNLNMNASSSTVCSGAACNAISIGSALNMRYGRLRLDDAFGPESARLPVGFTTEYWSGSFFTKNTDDNCTKILRSMIMYPAGNILSPANLNVNLGSGTTTGNYGSLLNTPIEIAFTNGDALHFFSAPTGGATGSFNVDVNLTSYPWLRFDWDQSGVYDDANLPTARFGFGSYRGHDRIIYWRERF